jgi:drug/metabolite transporter (DMT)-like permease
MPLHQSAIQWPGVPLALGSAVLFGAATPLSKLLLASIGPPMLAGLLYLGAGLKHPHYPDLHHRHGH